jgi:hypothetical protein
VTCYGYSVATYRNHTLRKTVLRNVLHERLNPRTGPAISTGVDPKHGF